MSDYTTHMLFLYAISTLAFEPPPSQNVHYTITKSPNVTYFVAAIAYTYL